MEGKTDQNGNVYFDVGNIRITAIPETWDGNPGIRIQAYKGDGNKLYQGAELPVESKETGFDIVAALLKAIEINAENS